MERFVFDLGTVHYTGRVFDQNTSEIVILIIEDTIWDFRGLRVYIYDDVQADMCPFSKTWTHNMTIIIIKGHFDTKTKQKHSNHTLTQTPLTPPALEGRFKKWCQRVSSSVKLGSVGPLTRLLYLTRWVRRGWQIDVRPGMTVCCKTAGQMSAGFIYMVRFSYEYCDMSQERAS